MTYNLAIAVFSVPLTVLPLLACGRHTDHKAIPRVALNEHGLRLRHVIGPTAVSCTDGRTRTVGGRGALQLITFSAASDCSDCERHLMGLKREYGGDPKLGIDQFFVTYGPADRRVDILGQYRARTAEPVCMNDGASLWHQQNISHTPFTILVRNGRILYIDDAPLDTRADQELFFANVVSAAHQRNN